ncbi:hypothetical protein [Anabaena sp. CCY 9910]|uniref:hypothetical protein n=1 Tax=Anabaena sp. CCY 9910 TaxID=3103870 RepID=UPI0039E06720
MQEIEDLNKRIKVQRKITTYLVGGLIISGLSSTLPLWNDSIKWSETLFCFQKSQNECEPEELKRGVSWIVENERRNFIFDNKVTFIRTMPPEDNVASLYGAMGTVALLGAWGISKTLTDAQEKAIHNQFSVLKVKALENDIIINSHLDLTQFSKQQQSEITKSAIARQATETIDAMKSPGEIALDEINGRLQGEIALKNHEFQVSEIDKQIADNRLSTAKTNKELAKINSDKQQQDKSTHQLSTNEQLKLSLIDALKKHEDGYLWKIINNLKPLWLIGNQGSGKTYTAGAIALIRKYCLDAPVYQLIDRHATGDNADVWQYLNPVIKAESEEEINQAFFDCCERWQMRIKQKPKQKQQVIVDEFTNLQKKCGESATTFFEDSLTDTRKAQEYLLGITHNATNHAFAANTFESRKAGTILLEKFSANNETPLPRVVVRYGLLDDQGNNLKDEERTIPSWLHPEKIYKHFTGQPIIFED